MLPIPALAHSQLVSSDPAAGALLNSSPQTLRLEWSEAVSLQFSSIKVYDRSRTEQRIGALGQPAGQDTVIKASLPDTLPPGTYTVIWRVVSGADGHLTAGSFAFRVKGSGTTDDDLGPVAPDQSFDAGIQEDTQAANPFRWTVRAAILIGAILLLGGSLFVVGVANPTIGDKKANHLRLAPILRERTGAIGSIIAGIVILALLLDLVAQVMSINSIGFFDAINRSDTAWGVLTGTRYGLAWFLKFFAALVLGGIMLFVWRVPRDPAKMQRGFGPAAWDLAAAAGSLLILGQSLSSHAAAIHVETVAAAGDAATHAAEPHNVGLPIPVLADWVHMLAASLWAGGLLYMTLVMFPALKAASYTPDERKLFLSKAIPRFSRLAILGVVVLAITGTYSTILHSADPGVILSTGYGWVLFAKVLAFCVLVGIGAINLLRLSPALNRTAKTEAPQTSLMGNVRVEAGLVVLALVCAAGLTLLPPPADASATPTATPTPIAVAPTPIPTPAAASVYTVEAGYNLTMTIKPSLEGDQFTLNIVNETGAAAPLTDVAKVLFKVTPQDVDGGSTSYEAEAQGDITPNSATWGITEPVFTLDGVYLVTAILQRTVAPDLKAGFYLNLNESSLTGQAVGIVDIRLSTDPSPPISGTATLRLDVRDGTNQPIDGARITVNPLMPAHAHIEPPGPAEPVAGEPGIYTFNVRFIMGGAWLITFNVERDGQPTLKTDASLDVIGPEIDLPPPTP